MIDYKDLKSKIKDSLIFYTNMENMYMIQIPIDAVVFNKENLEIYRKNEKGNIVKVYEIRTKDVKHINIGKAIGRSFDASIYIDRKKVKNVDKDKVIIFKERR